MKTPTIDPAALRDQVNFLITNPPGRRWLTTLFGRFSRIENRLVAFACIGLWRIFSPLDLSDAEETRFRSLQLCFTRRLRPGARPVDGDPAALTSPCDAIIGASGLVEDGMLLQVKGMPYALADLLGDAGHAARFRDGSYVTLRLTASMYHRFHAPQDIRVRSVTHVPGDCRNVNPPTLARIAGLYCRNERAIIRSTMEASGDPLTLVAVAAILVSGIRLAFLDLPHGKPPAASSLHGCDTAFRRGEEMGWFEHGSTIVVFAPSPFSLCPTLHTGMAIRMGQALMRRPPLRPTVASSRTSGEFDEA